MVLKLLRRSILKLIDNHINERIVVSQLEKIAPVIIVIGRAFYAVSASIVVVLAYPQLDRLRYVAQIVKLAVQKISVQRIKLRLAVGILQHSILVFVVVYQVVIQFKLMAGYELVRIFRVYPDGLPFFVSGPAAVVKPRLFPYSRRRGFVRQVSPVVRDHPAV